jgi:hypothetical protein
MYRYALLVFLLALSSCSQGTTKENKAEYNETTPALNSNVPNNLKRYVYPKSRVDRVLSVEGTFGIVMKTGDDLRTVAKFYLDRFGKPDDKVVTGQMVSYLYRMKEAQAMIQMERENDGTVISVSVGKVK